MAVERSPDVQIDVVHGIGKSLGRFYHPLLYMFALYAMRTGKSYLYGVFASPWSFETMGIGKSVYALKTLVKVYGSWEEARKWIVFMPQDFLRVFDVAKRLGSPAKMILWDDAGMWIGRMRWQDRYVKAVREFLNVIRTHCYNLVFTAPSINELVSGVRSQINIFAFISSYSENPPRSRAAIVLKPWVEQYLSRKSSARVAEVFDRYFEFYDEYYRVRKMFVDIGARRLEASLEEVIREVREASSYIRDSYRDIEVGEALEDVEEPGEEDVEELLRTYRSRW